MNSTKRKNLIIALVVGLIAGAFAGWEFTLGNGWKYGLAMGLTMFVLGTLFTLCQFDTRTQREAVSTIKARKKESLAAAMIIGILAGLILGTAAGLAFGLKIGLAIGAAAGLIVGPLFGIAVKRQPDIE